MAKISSPVILGVISLFSKKLCFIKLQLFCRLQLYKNNRFQVTAYGSRRDYQQASNSVMLLLRAGDIVHLQLEQGTIYEHPGNEAYTTFSGYLVESI